jgi:hypothetical protein
MTRVPTTPLAVSADYHDALVAARRAKNWLFLLLLLGLLAQITIFFLVRFDVVNLGAEGTRATVSVPRVNADVDLTTQPTTGPAGESGTDTDVDASASVTTRPSNIDEKVGADNVAKFLAWIVNSIVYLGQILSIVLAIIVLLIVLMMLVGRLLGVAHTTSAFVWAVILAALLFPWQLFHGPETDPGSPSYAANVDTVRPADDFRVPGVLYTWGELRRDARFGKDGNDSTTANNVLKWARFAGFPLLALIILFMVQAKSGRGVKYALGEAEVHVEVATESDLR